MRLSESMRKRLKNYEIPSTILYSLSYPSLSFTFLSSVHQKSPSRRGTLILNHAVRCRNSTAITPHEMVAYWLLHWCDYLLHHRQCPRGNMDLPLIWRLLLQQLILQFLLFQLLLWQLQYGRVLWRCCYVCDWWCAQAHCLDSTHHLLRQAQPPHPPYRHIRELPSCPASPATTAFPATLRRASTYVRSCASVCSVPSFPWDGEHV
jgi:hypothetical protein